MSELSKQALQVENTQSFPNNNTGYITPSKLREFNVDMIDSLVDEQTYNVDSASWNNSIDALETFTASQQPSFTALNAFTASQLGINSGVNSFTQSADGRLDTLESEVANIEAFTVSINEIRDNGTLQGYSTRFFFEGLVSASITPNVNGAIATIKVEQDGTKLNTASFNAYTNSVDISASLALTTASFDNGTRNLTFTKGDTQTFSVNIPDVSGSAGNFVTTASFNVYTASTDSDLVAIHQSTQSLNNSVSTLNSFTASQQSLNGTFATTGSNTFTGNQTISNGALINIITGSSINLFESPTGTSAIRFWSGSTVTGDNPRWVNMQPQPGGGGTLAISAFPENNHFVFFNPAIWTTQFESVVTGYGDGDRLKIGSGLQVTGSSIISGSTDITGSTSVQGTFNVAGVQTINYTNGSGLGEVYLLADSGSLVIGNSLSQPAYGSLAHLSSSTQNGNTNLIFKPNTSTGDTIISGSSNIFTNPAGATAGFKRYVGGSLNYFGATLPQITGSAGFSPSMNNNILNTGMVMRIPVSSSAYTMNGNLAMNPASNGINLGTSATLNFEKAVSGLSFLNNALFGGTINMVANGNTLSSSVSVSGNLSFGGTVNLNHFSSSIIYSSNINNGSLTINNRFTPAAGTSAAALGVRGTTNTIYGIGHVVNVDGTNTSTTIGKSFSYNILAGTFLTSSIGTGDASAINATAIIGNGLIVTGSTLPSTFAGPETANSGQGSLFTGRFNSLNGTTDMTAETIFAVGTGTSYTNRKTGFLIDSGSNTFVEGTLNVSGSTTMTGSLSIAPTFEVKFATGSNQQAGTAVLDGGNPGSATISNSLVTANSIIMLTKQTFADTNSRGVAVVSKGAGTFTISSGHNGDTDTVGWFIINNS